MRRALPLALSLLTLTSVPTTATAGSPLNSETARLPWGRGTLVPGFGLGGSFGSRGGGSLLIAGSLTYYVVNNLGLGLSLRNQTTFLSPSIKSEYPGIEKQIPTNEFSLIPGMTIVLHRGYFLSPYIAGGVGPVFLNHKRGVVGEWNAGPGLFIGIASLFAINLGFNFSMRFPSDRCENAYSYGVGEAAVSLNSCGVRFGVQAGLVFGFGVGRKRNPPPPPAPTYTPEPYPDPAPAPAPAEPPANVAPAAPVPYEEPTTAEQPLAPSPGEAPATAPPPGESVPVAPPPGE